MRTEQEIKEQIKRFEDERERYWEMSKRAPDTTYLVIINHLDSIDKEITALKWVLGETA